MSGLAAGPLRASPPLRELEAAVRPLLSTLAYTLRTMLAIGLALYVSFSLQLLSPLSSVVTVLIVANPVTGALVSKSLWRLFGTVLGAAAAVALFALFAQSPILFTLALSLCIGLACVVSTLLRYFQAYGAVLAGYTIIIVASGSFADPQNIFIGALSRVSSVSVGLLSTALVFLLTSLPRPSRLEGAIEALVRDVATGFLAYRDHGPGRAATLPRAELLRRANALDEQIVYAGADSHAVRARMMRLRRGGAGLLGLLSALEPLHDRFRRHDPGVDAARRAAHDTMRMLAGLAPGGLGAALSPIEAAGAAVRAIAAATTDPDALTVVLHEHDLLEQLAEAVGDLDGRGAGGTRLRLLPYLDWSSALRNGLRGGLVTLLGGLFWYVTQWPSGPTLLSYLIPAACLLSTNPSASQASLSFALGTVLAIPASLAAQVFLLPQIDGFPLLWGSLCLCLAPGIWLQFHPRHGLRAFGYVVFFNAMVNIHNPITFDDIALLNTWEAFAVGVVCLVLVFRVLLPVEPRREAVRLAASLGRAVEHLARPRRRFLLPSWPSWQNRQMQKILRLVQRMAQVAGLEPAEPLRQAFAVVALGRVVLTLQALRAEPALDENGRAAALRALQAVRRLRRSPARAAAAIEAAAGTTQTLLPAPDAAPDAAFSPASGTAPAPAPAPAPDNASAVAPHPARLLVGTLGEAAVLVARAGPLLDRRGAWAGQAC